MPSFHAIIFKMKLLEPTWTRLIHPAQAGIFLLSFSCLIHTIYRECPRIVADICDDLRGHNTRNSRVHKQAVILFPGLCIFINFCFIIRPRNQSLYAY